MRQCRLTYHLEKSFGIGQCASNTRGSPFLVLLKDHRTPKKSGVVIDTALVKIAENSLKNYGALAIYKGAGRQQSDVNGMFLIMVTFWNAVGMFQTWDCLNRESFDALGRYTGYGSFDGPNDSAYAAK